jgi:hypothetical protein
VAVVEDTTLAIEIFQSRVDSLQLKLGQYTTVCLSKNSGEEIISRLKQDLFDEQNKTKELECELAAVKTKLST